MTLKSKTQVPILTIQNVHFQTECDSEEVKVEILLPAGVDIMLGKNDREES